MDFIQNIYFSFESLGYLKLLLFQIRFQPGVAYKSDAYKKACNIVFSLLKMKKSLCHISLFLCLPGNPLGWYCQKKCCQKWVLTIWGAFYGRGFKPSAHYTCGESDQVV